ncbi:polysaccharide biosynthesis tyrosine autokinase [Amnibacterium kyonggiense]
MELTDFVLLLRRRAGFIIVMMLVGILAAAVFSGVQKPTYTAVAKSLVSTPRASNASDLQQGGTFTQQVVTTYAEVASTTSVLQKVVDELHLNMTADDLANDVSATAPANTAVVAISAKAGSAQLAADIANDVAKELAARVPSITPSTTAGRSAVSISLVQSATAAATTKTPNWTIDIALGLLVGLVAGVGIAVLREAVDTRLRGAKDAIAVTRLPVLGQLGADRGARHGTVLAPFASGSPRSERFRALRTNLQVLLDRRDASVLVVSASGEHEGTTTVVANTAVALAAAGQRVLVVDGNLRAPKLASMFDAQQHPGLAEVLTGSADVDAAITQWSDRGSILPAGGKSANQSELLQSTAMAVLLERLRERFDVILIDTPAALDYTDAVALSRNVDGVVLVAAAGHVKREALGATAASFEQVGAHLLGVVVTKLRGSRLNRADTRAEAPLALTAPARRPLTQS